MSWAPMVFQAASLVFSAVSAFGQAKSEKKWAEYNSAVANNNAKISEMQAADALERGKLARQEHERKVRALSGKQTATLAANGLQLDSGTPFNLLSDTELFGRMDANTITNDADRKAWSYQVQANNERGQADAYEAKADSISPGSAAGMTLLSGAPGVASSWMSYSGSSGSSYSSNYNIAPTSANGPGINLASRSWEQDAYWRT